LATIVGESPSDLPADVGVFIVSDGKLIKEEQINNEDELL